MKLITTTMMAFLVGSVAYAAPYVKVSLSSDDKRYSCEERFRGVLAPKDKKDKLSLRIETNELVGDVTYKVMYTNNGYKNKMLEKYESFDTKSKEIKVPYYKIEDNKAFAVNQVFVTATDSSNNSVSTSFTYRVYRSLVIEKSSDMTQDCFTMYKTEKVTGIYTNTTSSPRRVTVEDRLTESASVSKGGNSGWSFRLSPFNIAHLGYNKGYVKSKSRGVNLSSSVNVETTIAPGESIMLTRQMTLHKDAYDVKVVNECGELEDAGTATYSFWVAAYPVATLDMSLENPLGDFNVGYDDQLNTCSELENDDADIYTPDSDDEEVVSVEVADEEVEETTAEVVNDGGFFSKLFN